MSGPADSTAAPTLRQSVTGPLLLLLVVGDILGAGIYILIGDVAGHVGPAAWLPFVVAFVIAALSASSYSELVTRFPGSAGSALYAQRAFRHAWVPFVVGMAVMLSSLSTAATTARAFAGNYLQAFITPPVAIVAVALLVALTALSLRGIELSARVNVGMTLIEIGGLVLVLVIGGAAIFAGEGDPGRPIDLEMVEVDGLLTATALAFFAFLGFEDAVHLSEEVQQPRRTFPRVMFGAVAIASTLYFAVVIVATMAVDSAVLATSDGPLLEVVQAGPLAMNQRVFAAVALVAVANTSLFALVASSRLLYGMATDGSIHPVFARVHRHWRTPTVASIAVAVTAAGLATTGAVEDLAGAAVTLLLAVLFIVNIAAIRTRTAPEAAQAFRAPALVAPAGAVASGGLLTHQLFTSDAQDLARIGVLMGIVAALWIVSRTSRLAGDGEVVR